MRLSRAIIALAPFLACGCVVSGAPQARNTPAVVNANPTGQKSVSVADSIAQKPQSLQVELINTIRAKKAKAGDLVKARTVTALILPGQLVIPEGSKLIGHVTQASGATAANTAIAIAFDRFELKGRQRLPASFAIRSGAMREQTAQPLVVGDGADEGGRPPSTSAAPNPQKPTHMTMGGFTKSAKTRNTQLPQSESRREQPPGPAVLADDDRGDMRAVPKGTLSGMHGVTLRLDDASGAATFESANRKLALRSGLQLMLSVEPVGTVAPVTSGAQKK